MPRPPGFRIYSDPGYLKKTRPINIHRRPRGTQGTHQVFQFSGKVFAVAILGIVLVRVDHDFDASFLFFFQGQLFLALFNVSLQLSLLLVQVQVGGLLHGVLVEHGLGVVHLFKLEVSRRHIPRLEALDDDGRVGLDVDLVQVALHRVQTLEDNGHDLLLLGHGLEQGVGDGVDPLLLQDLQGLDDVGQEFSVVLALKLVGLD